MLEMQNDWRKVSSWKCKADSLLYVNFVFLLLNLKEWIPDPAIPFYLWMIRSCFFYLRPSLTIFTECEYAGGSMVINGIIISFSFLFFVNAWIITCKRVRRTSMKAFSIWTRHVFVETKLVIEAGCMSTCNFQQ